MKYVSTRGATLGSFSDVLLSGLAPDGGLAMPEVIPTVTPEQLEAWRALSYADLAYEVMRPFITDIPEGTCAACCATRTRKRPSTAPRSRP